MENRSVLKKTAWGWKELIYLLGLVLILVPFFIEYLLMNFLTELFQNNLYSGTLIGFIMAIIFLTGLYVIALRPYRLSWKAVGIKAFSRTYYWKIVWWTLLLIAVSIVLAILMSFLDIGVENHKTASLQAHLTPFSFLIGFMSAAIVSPVYEEIFYRGFLYKFFRDKLGIGTGMLISSFIFMLVHIPNYNVLPVTFVTGLLLSWVYQKTGSVIPCILIHSIFNGIAVTLTAFA